MNVNNKCRAMRTLSSSTLILVIKCWLFIRLLPVTHCYENSTQQQQFIDNCRSECAAQKDLVVCGKYKFVSWLNDVREKDFKYGPFKLVRIPAMQSQPIFPKLPRPRGSRTGIGETLHFVRETVEDLLTKRALAYGFEEPTTGARSFSTGPLVLTEDELSNAQKGRSSNEWRIFHKKKKFLIIPLLILLNLVKLKLLILPVLIGVHFIKKILVVGSLALPSFLAHLRICKVAPHQQGYPYHSWATAAETPVDYPSGYGHEDVGWANKNDYHGTYAGYPSYSSNGYSGYLSYLAGNRHGR